MLTDPHHIIAIGASAGGMEEINTFFDHTPLDEVSYVIILHLSPVYKSRMVELVARHSKLVVREAENNMQVSCNEVYLIPNDKFMSIAGKKFILSDKSEHAGPHLTINTFFNSLAAAYGKKSIGVILSGLGSDGTEGAIAIKKAGGMVMARNPETSQFGSMPSSAIASGVVDMVLEPEQMPYAIENYIQEEIALINEHKKEVENIKAIIRLINEQSSLDFSDYKQPTILRRIMRRAASHNFNNVQDYFSFLKTDKEELEMLAQDFLISVTSFFRDKQAFEVIEKKILPGILEKLLPGEELKLWVAGCATGEEAYSLAIIICEHLTGKYKDTVVKIFATDLDSVAIAIAAKGQFGPDIVKDISPERLEKYFIKEGEHYRIGADIRKMLIFAHHDLVKNPPYCNMHFISCRNLLIYMTPALQKKVYLMLLFGLRKNGYLFLGSSENPMTIIQHLEVIDKKWKIYRNLETKKSVYFEGFALPQMAAVKDSQPSGIQKEKEAVNNNTIVEAVNTAMANEQEYLIICIDANNQVMKTYGDTGKFLLQKNFNLNLPELLTEPLAIALNGLTITARKTNAKAAVHGIKIKSQNTVLKVNLTAIPLEVKNTNQPILMIIFTADKETPADDVILFEDKKYLDDYTRLLEDEVKALKDKLENTYVQLDASNDNMQAYNQELLSANEEMQSTNEEMQSVNEELHTINTDYQLKNKELLELNDDLNNYFRSSIHGQLFVNRELQLMKFSPATTKLINLLPGDIGRPLSNLSTNIKFETLADDIAKVLEGKPSLTREIETVQGQWYQLQTMPYIQQADNKINGAIVTFNDITELKNTQIELNKKNKSLQRINEDLDTFIHTASHDLLAPLGNIEMSIAIMNEVKVIDPELQKFLDIINSSVKKFRALITEISTIAKVEGEMLVSEMVDIEEIIKSVEWSLSEKIRSSGAVINRNLEVTEVLFSKKNLRSVLFNLISNGIKFQSAAAPVITIVSVKRGNNVVLSVQDNGIGIDQADVDKIFGMYNRLNSDIEGQGVGLYLVKKIIDSSGGNVSVQPVKEGGCKFILYLNFA